MPRTATITLEADDPRSAEHLCSTVLGIGDCVRVRASQASTTGFRGVTLSLVVPGPADVDALIAAAVEAGAEAVTPATRSLWGYGGTVRTPDGTVCTLASSSKKDRGPATRKVEAVVLQLGVADVRASKQFYVDHGVPVAKSAGRRYVELDTAPVKVALLPRTALAKAAGVPADGSGAHRVAVTSDAGPFTDPDGFVWEGPAG